ncbi:MAG: GUN4 domain-containing protein, partial [Trichodesmium sp. St2_bin2_1]|nr:GUN4 domain-containing protein [Trichodesmium sp. St2_bin2_1]
EEREAERRQREQLEAERRKREEAERRSQQLEAEREKERQEAEQRAKKERAAQLQRQQEQEKRRRQQAERREQEQKAKKQRQVENEISLASARGVDYRKLRDLLAAGRWKEADLETDRVILKAARRESEGYLRKSDAENFSCQDLRTIDKLWLKYSNGNFGLSVQKQIYQSLGGTKEYDREVWRKFGDKVGWRKGGKWLFNSEYTFSKEHYRGHLPTVARMYGGGLESILLGDWMNSSFLVWRPVDCNI